jgi:uncharacterized protein (TIGR02421 family)
MEREPTSLAAACCTGTVVRVTDRAERLSTLDARLVSIAKKVRLLGSLTWPSSVLDGFLDGWRRGSPTLPEPPKEEARHEDDLRAFAELRRDIDQHDPVGRFLDDTAGSYALAARMLDVRGSGEFLEIGRVLYGMPSDPIPGSKLTHLDAAEQLLHATSSLKDAGVRSEPDFVISSEGARAEMQVALDAFFGEDVVRAVIDPDLGSKAAAGSKNVRLRGRTGFSEMEIAQLLEHEAFVHAATALNGKQQPVLTSMALAAPRSTLTQEGLATLAELVTRTIDITRLRRIALRIKAIAMALEGADFVDVFRFFLDEGQSEDDSVRSAMRVFRGGDPRGKYVFTKDVVYVQGLVAVHTFLRKAIASHRPVLIERMFAGRIHLSDVLMLEAEFESGLIAPPKYLPRWARDVPTLAAYLAFAAVAYRIDVGTLELDAILPAVDL